MTKIILLIIVIGFFVSIIAEANICYKYAYIIWAPENFSIKGDRGIKRCNQLLKTTITNLCHGSFLHFEEGGVDVCCKCACTKRTLKKFCGVRSHLTDIPFDIFKNK